MKDYSSNLERIQRAIGRAYQESGLVLGVPGISIAVKIDPHYYLAVMPSFITRTAQWAGMFPRSTEETLKKTGNLITGADRATFQIPVTVIWGEPPTSRRIKAAFLPADFIDRSIMLFGGADTPMPVTDLRLDVSDKPQVAMLFKGKTSIDKTAFSQQI